MADFDEQQLENVLSRLNLRVQDDDLKVQVKALTASINKIYKELNKNFSSANQQQTIKTQSKAFATEMAKLPDMQKRTPNAINNSSKSNSLANDPAFGSAKNDLKKTMKNADSAFGSVIGRFKQLDGTLAGFVASIGIGGYLGKHVADALDKNIDVYRQMTGVGETFSGSMLKMSQAAATNGISLDTLSKAMQNGSQGLRQLGGTDFAKFNKKMVDAIRPLGLMGLTTDQLVGFESEYLEQQRLAGKAGKLSSMEQINGVKNLVTNTTSLAAAFGKTREEIMASMKQENQDVNFQAFLSTLSTTGQEQSRNLLEIAKNTGGEGGVAALKDIMMTGAVTSEKGLEYMQLNQGVIKELTSAAGQAKSGKLDAMDVVAQLKIANKQDILAFGGQANAAMQGNLGNQYAQALNLTTSLLNGANPLRGTAAAKNISEKGGFDEGTKNLLLLQNSTERLTATFNNLAGTVLDVFSPQLTKLLEGFTKLFDVLSTFTTSWLGHLSDNQKMSVMFGGALVAGAVAIKGVSMAIGTMMLPFKMLGKIGAIGGAAEGAAVGMGGAGSMLATGGKLLGKMALRGGGALTALSMGKDAYNIARDEVSGTKVKKEDIGGIAGGILGGVIGALGGPVGVVIGAGIGNKAGEYVGGLFDDKKANDTANVFTDLNAPKTPEDSLTKIASTQADTNDTMMKYIQDLQSQNAMMLDQLTKIERNTGLTNKSVKDSSDKF